MPEHMTSGLDLKRKERRSIRFRQVSPLEHDEMEPPNRHVVRIRCLTSQAGKEGGVTFGHAG